MSDPGDFGGSFGGLGDLGGLGDTGGASFGGGLGGGLGFGGGIGNAGDNFGSASLGDGTGSFGGGDNFGSASLGDNFGFGQDLSLGDAMAGIAAQANPASYSNEGVNYPTVESTAVGPVNASMGLSGGFGQGLMGLLTQLARGKAFSAVAGKTGIPAGFLGIMANLAQGKNPAPGMAQGLLGPFAMVDSVLSMLTGKPSIAQSVAGVPPAEAAGMPTGAQGMGFSGMLPALANLGMSLYGMNQARGIGRPNGAQGAAGASLEQLIRTGDVTAHPAWRGVEQGITRRMASQGYLGSGNMMAALRDTAGNFFDQHARTLSQLSQVPGTQIQGDIARTQLRGEALNRGMYGMRELMPYLQQLFNQPAPAEVGDGGQP